MPDPTLASIISGTNPLDPQMLNAYQGAQLSNAAIDPNFGHNEGPFGALAKLVAGARGSQMLNQGVQQTTAANTAAMPDLARLLANPDPFTALAQGGINPIAAARLLQGATPESAADARLKAAQAALAGAQVNAYNNPIKRSPFLIPPAQPTSASSGTPTSISDFTTGRQPLDPVSAVAALAPEQRSAAIAAMSPQQKAAYLARLRAMQQGGRGNATRPPA
jgi:hypothetical protein